MRKYCLNENYFDCIDVEDKAYWYGMLWADGLVTDGGAISLGLHCKDEEMVLAFKRSIEAKHPIYNQRRQKVITVGSRCMAKSLQNLNIVPRKTFDNSEPLVPHGLVPHFIRGLFDGDGYIRLYQLTITNTQATCLWVQRILLNASIKSRVYKEPNANCCRVAVSDRENLSNFAHFIYDGATLYLRRKQAIFEKYGYLAADFERV